jgi:hypothetical protein
MTPEEADADPFLSKDDHAGLSTRAVGALFRQIGQQAQAGTHAHEVSVGLVEIYNEKIRDLLHGAQSRLGVGLMGTAPFEHGSSDSNSNSGSNGNSDSDSHSHSKSNSKSNNNDR